MDMHLLRRASLRARSFASSSVANADLAAHKNTLVLLFFQSACFLDDFYICFAQPTLDNIASFTPGGFVAPPAAAVVDPGKLFAVRRRAVPKKAASVAALPIKVPDVQVAAHKVRAHRDISLLFRSFCSPFVHRLFDCSFSLSRSLLSGLRVA